MRWDAKRIALCGMLCALAEVLLMLGSILPAALYCCPILAMAALLPVREELGPRAALTVYAATALLALVLLPNREAAGIYLFWGWYPAAQPRLDRIRPRGLGMAVKLLSCTLALAVLYGLLIFLFQMQTVVSELREATGLLLAGTGLLLELVFWQTDRLLHRLAELWRERRPKRWLR